MLHLHLSTFLQILHSNIPKSISISKPKYLIELLICVDLKTPYLKNNDIQSVQDQIRNKHFESLNLKTIYSPDVSKLFNGEIKLLNITNSSILNKDIHYCETTVSMYLKEIISKYYDEESKSSIILELLYLIRNDKTLDFDGCFKQYTGNEKSELLEMNSFEFCDFIAKILLYVYASSRLHKAYNEIFPKEKIGRKSIATYLTKLKQSATCRKDYTFDSNSSTLTFIPKPVVSDNMQNTTTSDNSRFQSPTISGDKLQDINNDNGTSTNTNNHGDNALLSQTPCNSTTIESSNNASNNSIGTSKTDTNYIGDIQEPKAEFLDAYYGFAVDEFISLTSLDSLFLDRFNDIQRFIVRMEKSINYYTDKNASSFKNSIYERISDFVKRLKKYYNVTASAFNNPNENPYFFEIYANERDALLSFADDILQEIDSEIKPALFSQELLDNNNRALYFSE